MIFIGSEPVRPACSKTFRAWELPTNVSNFSKMNFLNLSRIEVSSLTSDPIIIWIASSLFKEMAKYSVNLLISSREPEEPRADKVKVEWGSTKLFVSPRICLNKSNWLYFKHSWQYLMKSVRIFKAKSNRTKMSANIFGRFRRRHEERTTSIIQRLNRISNPEIKLIELRDNLWNVWHE